MALATSFEFLKALQYSKFRESHPLLLYPDIYHIIDMNRLRDSTKDIMGRFATNDVRYLEDIPAQDY